MKILTINAGSSSVKYQFIDTQKKTALCRGLIERIGIEGTNHTHKRIDGAQTEITEDIANHQSAIESILGILTDTQYGVIENLDQIDAVGHRLVHAGEKFKQSVKITREVREKLYECIEYAPLHNPPNIKGIEACLEKLPEIPNVGVFDTTFHVNMPDYAYLYGIPYEYYQKYSIRRYGFHGTSHYYVANRAAELLEQDITQLKLITCHLGNGSSVTAVKKGISVDTSMGFTPLEGLLMGTRCGDIDPGVIFTIANRKDFSVEDANNFFNKRCGLRGLSGLSSDVREIEKAAQKGNYQAQLAVNVFAYRLKKYIGAYLAAMNGCDAIVFAGGIGENSDIVRERSLQDLDVFGIKLDKNLNRKTHKKEAIISTPDSGIKVLVIPTNEELVIALETERIVSDEAQN